MAVSDIPAELIVNERTSWAQYLWRLPEPTEKYRWDANVVYMYSIRATPVEGQGLPPLPPAPDPGTPFGVAQQKYLDGHYVRTVNGIPIDASGNVVLPIIDETARQAAAAARAVADAAVPKTRVIGTGTGLVGGGNLSADLSIRLSDAAQAQLGRADAAYNALSTKADLVNGVVPTSQLPALAITDTFVVSSQAAMLALTAQRGDIAKRTDLNGQAFVLSADNPTTLANWVSLNTTSDVSSVNGQTGTVVLGKGDVGLGNVDNTSDVNKPVSTAQQNALNGKVANTRNVTAGSGLTGGGSLGQDISFALNSATQTSLTQGVNAFGMVTGGRLGPLGSGEPIDGTGDYNSMTQSGFYRVYNGKNGPGTEWFYILVQAHDSNYIYQRATGYTGSTQGITFERQRLNGAWTNWIQYTDSAGSVDNSLRAIINPSQRLAAKSQLISSTDLNVLYNNGWYGGDNLTNSPNDDKGFFYIKVQRSFDDSSYAWQIATRAGLGTSGAGAVFQRFAEGVTNGVVNWSGWRQLSDRDGGYDGAIRGDINNRMRYAAFDVGAARDLNTITDSGWYLGGSGNPNSPYGGRWLMDVRTAATGYSYQRFVSIIGDSAGWVWERYTNSGTAGGSWQPWRQVVDSAGALDATARARADLAAFASLPSARDLYAADSWNRTRFGLNLPANQAPTLSMLYGAVPIDSTYVADGGDLGQNLGDYYIGQLRTMVRVAASKTISLTLTHDDGAQFYVDGKSVYSSPAYTQGVTVQFTLTVGWHILDWLWLEQAGGDGIFGISPTLRSQVDEMFAPVSETRRASDAAAAVKTVNGITPDSTGNVVVSGGGGGGTGTVQSVNGKGPNASGAVTLVPADIGAASAATSVYGTGAITGGGNLGSDRSLDLTTAAKASLSRADSAVQSVNGKTGSAVSVAKSDIGLGNVDNTSDLNKPISTATSGALQLLQPKRRRIVYFGDSWGTQLYSPDPAMPNMLATALNADLVANHAISGSVLGPVGTSNSGGIERNTDTMVNNAKADTSYDKNSITDVVLVIGVNNILTYFPSMAQAVQNFKNISALYPNARFWYAANSKKSINATGDTDPWKFYSRFMEAASQAGWAAANYSPQWTWGVAAETFVWWPTDSVATTRHPTTAGLQAYANRLAGFMQGESWRPFFRVPMTIHADAVALNSSARISNDTTHVDGTMLMLDFAVASMSNSSASTASYQKAATIPERYAPNVPFFFAPVGTREGGAAMNFTYAMGINGPGDGVVSVDARVVRTNVSYFVCHASIPLDSYLALDAS